MSSNMPGTTGQTMQGAMMPWMGTAAPWFSKPVQAMPPMATPMQQPMQKPMQMQMPWQIPMQQPMQKPMQKPMQMQMPWQVPMQKMTPTKAQPAQVALSAPGPAAAAMTGPTQGVFRIPGFAINLDTPLIQGGFSWPGAQTMLQWPGLQGLMQLPGVQLQGATNPDAT